MSKRLTSLITLIAGLLLVAGIAVAQVGGSDDSTATSTSTTLEDNGGDRPDGVSDDSPGDISGPCDEAEHADDPRCTGAVGPAVESQDSDDNDIIENHSGDSDDSDDDSDNDSDSDESDDDDSDDSSDDDDSDDDSGHDSDDDDHEDESDDD